jgi:uncharacterized membrane protein
VVRSIKPKITQGDILSGYLIPRIPGVLDDDFVEYGLLSPHSCDLDGDYATVASAWRESTFRKLIENESRMGNILANNTLQYFTVRNAVHGGENLIADLHHITTWSMAAIDGFTRTASLDDDELEGFQAAMVVALALRTVTRKKRLSEYEGRTIARIRSVAEGNDQEKVTVTVDNDDAFVLWLYPRK